MIVTAARAEQSRCTLRAGFCILFLPSSSDVSSHNPQLPRNPMKRNTLYKLAPRFPDLACYREISL